VAYFFLKDRIVIFAISFMYMLKLLTLVAFAFSVTSYKLANFTTHMKDKDGDAPWWIQPLFILGLAVVIFAGTFYQNY
jgi:hypothetical protein